jgi:hypothetical protein
VLCYPVDHFQSTSPLRTRVHTHTHTHTLCNSFAMLGSTRGKPAFGAECRLAVALNLMSSCVTKHWPRNLIFSLGKSQKSPVVRYGMSAICFTAKNCCTAMATWPGELPWCRIHLISSHLICSRVNTKPQLLYPRERPGSHCIGGWVGTRVGLDSVWKISPPTRDLIPRLSARTESLSAHTRNRYKHQTWPASKLPRKFWGKNMKLVFSIYSKNFMELPTISY